MEACDQCANKQACGVDCDKLSYRQLLMAVAFAFVGVILLLTLMFRSDQALAAGVSCVTREGVTNAVKAESKCLVIFGDNVYDLTLAEKWDLTGHVGKHLCGKEYDKETIEKGPHKVSVMDKFLLNRLCRVGETPTAVGEAKKTGWPRTVLGMSWLKFSSYLALLFFLLNFATCYVMPWASVKEPWKGDRPGRDKNDLLGAFPLTHMHKIWAWLAIFSLSFHGFLGFAGVWFSKWY